MGPILAGKLFQGTLFPPGRVTLGHSCFAREWHRCSGTSGAGSGALAPSPSHSSVLSQLLSVATSSPQISACPWHPPQA